MRGGTDAASERPGVVVRERGELQFLLLREQVVVEAHGRRSTLIARRSSIAAYASATSDSGSVEVEHAARVDRAGEHVGQQLLDVAAHRRDAAVHADVAVEHGAHRAAPGRRSARRRSRPCRRGESDRIAWSIDSFVPTHSSTQSAPMPSNELLDRGRRPRRRAPRRCRWRRTRGRAPAGRRAATSRRCGTRRGASRRGRRRGRRPRRRRRRRCYPAVTPAETAAWWPVPITSARVSRLGMSSSSGVRGDGDEGAVGERHAHALALAAVGEAADPVVRAPPAAVEAGGAHAVQAVHAGVVADVERGDHEVARRRSSRHPAPTSSTMPTNSWPMRCGFVGRRHAAVGPEVGAAHAGGHDAHDRVAAGGEHGVGDLFESDVTFAVDEGRQHAPSLRRRAAEPGDGSRLRSSWRRRRRQCDPSDRPAGEDEQHSDARREQ